MKKIDTSNWKLFRIGDLFEEVEAGYIGTGKRIGSAVKQPDFEHSLPLTAAKNDNNGIEYWGKPEEYLSHENVIAVIRDGAVSTGRVFAQKEATSVYSHSYFIKLKKENPSFYTNQYLATILEATIYPHYTRDDACIWERVKNDSIMLPVADDNPDYKYMDSFMRKIMDEAKTNLKNLLQASKPKSSVDTREWKEFRLRDLFDFKLPQGDLQVKKVKDGEVPLITPSGYNNGFLQRISSDSDSTLFPANTLTVDMFGNAYYQEENYFVTAHGHVNVLIPKIVLNKNSGMFIATAIRSMFLNKYGFSEMCTQKVLKNEKVKLPITDDGNPDIEFMDKKMFEELKISSENIEIVSDIAKRI